MSARDVIARALTMPGPMNREAETDAILSALTAAGYAVEQGWQPIETAPRDGTPIDLWIIKERDGSPTRQPRRVPEARWWGHGDDLWVAHGVAYEPFQATAWRPLPAAPEARDDA